ncbi:ATP-binding cassette domain-containing protein, partial [Escherichia coli]|uniref:ATP-binding cassette domain-containing protein n=1 Tax=Escherichia coli TaxID=562 RepID=UPI0013D42C1E
QEPIISGVSFSLLAGQALGIIGPSASGKSTLARTLTGAWLPLRGSLRLDGAELGQWSAEARGGFIGYLAQDIGLFDGTVAEN